MGTTKNPAPETETETVAAAPIVDVVAVPSLRADGTPDQTPGFTQLADDEDEARRPAPAAEDAEA